MSFLGDNDRSILNPKINYVKSFDKSGKVKSARQFIDWVPSEVDQKSHYSDKGAHNIEYFNVWIVYGSL